MTINKINNENIDFFRSYNRIGVIGASGFLGSKLFGELSNYTKTVGTYFSKNSSDLIFLDIRDEVQVKLFWQQFKPDLLLIPGGITYPDVCEKNKEEAFKTNIVGIRNIMETCKCKVVYFSTDYVFDGEKGSYNEDDCVNPINYYGWTKNEAEKIILDSGDNVVLRVSGLYGYNERNNEFILSLKDNPVIYKADDCYSCNLLLDDVVNSLSYFLNKNGIFHLTDEVVMSRYEFTSMAAKILNIPCRILSKHSKDLYTFAKRPKNSSMISKKHKLKLHNPEEGLKYLKGIIER